MKKKLTTKEFNNLEANAVTPREGHPKSGDFGYRDRGEVRKVSESGGEKGQKPERMDLIPPKPLLELARQYGWGAEKYSDYNWVKGYPYSLALGALLRHVLAWMDGEDRDPESGNHHLAAAAWHAFTLMAFQDEPEIYGKYDDRFCKAQEKERVKKWERRT